jgi:hypothetical protein
MSMIVNPSRFTVVGTGPYDPDYGAHRYWRVRGLSNNGDPMACSELELRTVIGGPTVCTGGTPISRADYGGGYAKAYAFDGLRTDGHEWAAPGSSAGVEWIGYDFGAGNDKEIVEVSYTARQFFGTQSPNVAALEYSDNGTTWSLAFILAFNSFANGETKVRTVPDPLPTGANPHYYWRLYFFSPSGGFASARDGEIHLSIGGADITDTAPILYADSGHFSNWSFDRMFDNNISTLIALNIPGWGSMQFASPTTIEEIKWRARDGGGSNYQVPYSGAVQYSDDGVTWTDYWYWEEPTWADDETKTLSNPGPDAPHYHRAISRGNRGSAITLTATNIAASGGSVGALIDGATSDSYFWAGGTGDGSGYLKFDFTDKYLVDQIIWYQSSGTTQGTWRLEASNDNATWTQVGADFTLTAGVFNFANAVAYRYYRLRHMSGARSGGIYQREIDFRAGPPS